MLRPVDSLPDHRVTPDVRLSTPRSGQGVSPFDLGSATRRSGAYRDGTPTRWTHAARSTAPAHARTACFTTHHRLSLPAAIAGPAAASRRSTATIGAEIATGRSGCSSSPCCRWRFPGGGGNAAAGGVGIPPRRQLDRPALRRQPRRRPRPRPGEPVTGYHAPLVDGAPLASRLAARVPGPGGGGARHAAPPGDRR